jgi:hypothetical protein
MAELATKNPTIDEGRTETKLARGKEGIHSAEAKKIGMNGAKESGLSRLGKVGILTMPVQKFEWHMLPEQKVSQD